MVDLASDSLRRSPRWAVVAAYAVPACILPSAIWRVGGVVTGRLTADGTDAWYPMLLSVLSLGLGLLTLGLVHSWGERVPRWVPGLGGRPVPIKAAVVPAGVGAVVLLALVAHAVYTHVWNPIEQINPDLVLIGEKPADLRPLHVRDPEMFREVLWTYSPLAAWPVLLFAVTYAYHRRRTHVAT